MSIHREPGGPYREPHREPEEKNEPLTTSDMYFNMLLRQPAGKFERIPWKIKGAIILLLGMEGAIIFGGPRIKDWLEHKQAVEPALNSQEK